jgi:nicotinamide-nucleotide amidase
MGESSVENALADLMKTSTNPTVAPYCGNGEVRLRVTARGKDEAEAKAIIAPVVDKIKEVIGDFVYGVDVPSIESVVVEKLKERHLTVAFAESCTGGLISKRITDVPGASEVFGFGFCTYANEAKMKILGVKEETLAAHGAVSEETAYEMAQGLSLITKSNVCVSITGLAGGNSYNASDGKFNSCIIINYDNQEHVINLFKVEKGLRNDVRKKQVNYVFYQIIKALKEIL